MAQNDNELLFGEREQLLTTTICDLWSFRSGTIINGHIRKHIAAIRSIRGARAAYMKGLKNGLR